MPNTTFSELREKQIVNVCDGACFGRICDMEFDCDSGVICSIVVPGPPRLFGLIKGREELVIPFSHIRKIGDDVILVDVGELARTHDRE